MPCTKLALDVKKLPKTDVSYRTQSAAERSRRNINKQILKQYSVSRRFVCNNNILLLKSE